MSEMKEPEKELIRKHPYFVEEDDNDFYLKKDKDMYIISLGYDIEHFFPIKWNDAGERYLPIWQAEKWFKEIYKEVNELYFQNNRIRMLTKGMKRSIDNILIFACLEEEKGEEIYDSLDDVCAFETGIVLKKYESAVMRIKERAEKERYEVKIVERNDQVLAVTIC
jgi:hypothetical protein